MANPVLHIKDSYYFEGPKMLFPSTFQRMEEFPDVWVSLDEQYQDWHFERLCNEIAAIKDEKGFPIVNLTLGLDDKAAVHDRWKQWQHESHDNHGKPFDEFLEAVYAHHLEESAKFKAQTISDFEQARAEVIKSGKQYRDENMFQQAREMDLAKYLHYEQLDFMQFSEWRDDQAKARQWQEIRRRANDVDEFKKTSGVVWDKEKIDGYNYHLSGKVLIPQPFATLRNLYETHPANHWYEVGISKVMVIELVVAFLVGAAFIWLARKIESGGPPKGKVWNLLETFVVYIRDQVAEPAIGHHDAKRFLPYLWTLFFFVLGCNLMGMVPWIGAPTAVISVTAAFAALTLLFGVSASMERFGAIGFFKNLVPHMELNVFLKVPIFIMLLGIEFLGLLIKHGVLAIRLLANMAAGHLVLLAIMGIAFSVEAVSTMSDLQWGIAAVISIAGCTALSILELFVAFLQAYIITFLSALFIGLTLHEH